RNRIALPCAAQSSLACRQEQVPVVALLDDNGSLDRHPTDGHHVESRAGTLPRRPDRGIGEQDRADTHLSAPRSNYAGHVFHAQQAGTVSKDSPASAYRVVRRCGHSSNPAEELPASLGHALVNRIARSRNDRSWLRPAESDVALPWRSECAHRSGSRSEEHTSELQSRENLVCRLLLEKKKT